ncbi:HIT family protein [Kytococcus sedentarius]|uniref:HIT family protein n=1 Tax=Kytococcus sedentarius TaxID=1276 RepID=UPI0038510EA3
MIDRPDTPDDCVFCGIVAGTEPSAIVAQDEATMTFMDINPGTDGHLLVIPKRHSADVLDIPADDLVAATLVAQRMARAVVNGLDADGVTLLNCCGNAGWQSVFHFHLHVIPRYDDPAKDSLVEPYEPLQGTDADLPAIARRVAEALEG